MSNELQIKENVSNLEIIERHLNNIENEINRPMSL